MAVRNTAQALVIEHLNNTHNRPAFRCGVALLDNYIKKQAKQDVKRRVSQVYVATQSGRPKIIVGYYTLSTLSIELTDLPEVLSDKLPKYPVPTALIGRLAVTQELQGLGIGKMLLVDAIKRTLAVSNEIAIYAMVVDAKNEQVEQFYAGFGFMRLAVGSGRLFLPLKSF